MNKTLRLISTILGFAAGGALRAADSPAQRTEVVFDHPENFTDVKDAYVPTEKGRDAILGELRRYLVHVGDNLLPGGDRLTITFSDIRLAGQFEPWHSPMWQDVRFVRPVYPPHFKFTYAVTNAAGAVIRSGSEDILDAAFQMRTPIDSEDPLRYEKDILGEWARGALRGLKRA